MQRVSSQQLLAPSMDSAPAACVPAKGRHWEDFWAEIWALGCSFLLFCFCFVQRILNWKTQTCKDSDEFQQQSAHPFSMTVLPSKSESMAGGALSASCLPRHRVSAFGGFGSEPRLCPAKQNTCSFSYQNSDSYGFSLRALFG